MPEVVHGINRPKAACYRFPVVVLAILVTGSILVFSIARHPAVISWMVAYADEPTSSTIKKTKRYEAVAANWKRYWLKQSESETASASPR